jgi:hypothetical protein
MTGGTKGSTVPEVVLTVIYMLLTQWIWAYVINKVGSIVEKLNEKSQ